MSNMINRLYNTITNLIPTLSELLNRRYLPLLSVLQSRLLDFERGKRGFVSSIICPESEHYLVQCTIIGHTKVSYV